MKKSPAVSVTQLYTPRATLCALGLKVRSLKLFDPIAERVRIRQKAIRHTPIEKLQDAFIAILSGAHGLCEVNTRVRSDAAPCSAPSVGRRALSSRWCRRRSTAAQVRT